MQPGGIALGRILGIELRVNYTWLIAFVLITWSLAVGFYPQALPGQDAVLYWALGAASAVGLFASVLVHELAHSLLARARGLRVRGITLFIFGGASEIDAESRSPGDELGIAIVGPITSLVIAGVLFAATLAIPAATAVGAFVGYLALVNLVVGLFNLVPGFPLDGGRVLLSVIWAVTGSRRKATVWASYAGQLVGFLLIFGGVSLIFGGGLLGGIWLAFIGWFLNSAAEASRHQLELQEGLRGVPVSAVMDPTPPIAEADMRVREFVFERVLREGERAVLVVEGGRLAGIATITDAKRVPQEEWATRTVGEIMTTDDLRTVEPEADLATAVSQLASQRFHQLPVVRAGRPVGIVDRDDVMRAIALRAELGIDIERRERRPAA